jgi:predicted  nucleic acid-binding Zn-ribbon protein
LPLRLQKVFFTDGENVQNFISGSGSVDQRQTQVHEAIRSLLGLEALELAAGDLEQVLRKFRAEVARSAGREVEEVNAALEKVEDQIADLERQHAELTDQLRQMREQRVRWEKELDQIKGLGELDELNKKISGLDRDIATLEKERTQALLNMRGLVRSEDFSWALLEDPLNKGMKLLDDLADRGVIPGVSIEVLVDRLSLPVCFCGESLAVGDSDGERRRQHLQHLIEEQRHVAATTQRLTSVLHVARQSKATHDSKRHEGKDFWARRTFLLASFTEKRDALALKTTESVAAKERRSKIDDSRVRDLTTKIQRVGGQIESAASRVGGLDERIKLAKEGREEKKRALDQAESARNKDLMLATRRAVAEDLVTLAKGTLGVLERDYVARVGSRMAELFMQIVGSDPDFEAGVFTGVHIADNFDIVVDTHNGRRLDPAFELNGASQRALTLAFIWALMEVSDTAAPRIIDTPLGMVAGGVKRRMVDTITRPSQPGEPDNQVVLMLTRSEIRDIEDILDDRAGEIMTMSCSKDFPEDLVYPWDVDHPVVRTCTCSHRVSCRICARRYDEQHGVVMRVGTEV